MWMGNGGVLPVVIVSRNSLPFLFSFVLFILFVRHAHLLPLCNAYLFFYKICIFYLSRKEICKNV